MGHTLSGGSFIYTAGFQVSTAAAVCLTAVSDCVAKDFADVSEEDSNCIFRLSQSGLGGC